MLNGIWEVFHSHLNAVHTCTCICCRVCCSHILCLHCSGWNAYCSGMLRNLRKRSDRLLYNMKIPLQCVLCAHANVGMHKLDVLISYMYCAVTHHHHELHPETIQMSATQCGNHTVAHNLSIMIGQHHLSSGAQLCPVCHTVALCSTMWRTFDSTCVCGEMCTRWWTSCAMS